MQKQPSYQHLKQMLESAEKLIEAQKDRTKLQDEIDASNQRLLKSYQEALDQQKQQVESYQEVLDKQKQQIEIHEQQISNYDTLLNMLKQEFPEVKERLERSSSLPSDSLHSS